jgi:tRNA A-37 threonylcarbamoyl transferase component Bud32
LWSQDVDKTETTLLLKCLTLEGYQQFVANSTVLEQDGYGIKVLATAEGMIIKLFRRKRVLSSVIFKSYATRFVENARRLQSLGIETVVVDDVYRCSPIDRTLVVYRPVPGRTLRNALRNSADSEELMEQYAAFLAELHDKGVLFRSIHFNNVIVPESPGHLGLIDIADMKIFNRALSFSRRMRNLHHMTRYSEDCRSIREFGVERFVDTYFRAGKLASSHKKSFLMKMQSIIDADSKT